MIDSTLMQFRDLRCSLDLGVSEWKKLLVKVVAGNMLQQSLLIQSYCKIFHHHEQAD